MAEKIKVTLQRMLQFFWVVYKVEYYLLIAIHSIVKRHYEIKFTRHPHDTNPYRYSVSDCVLFHAFYRLRSVSPIVFYNANTNFNNKKENRERERICACCCKLVNVWEKWIQNMFVINCLFLMNLCNLLLIHTACSRISLCRTKLYKIIYHTPVM